MEFTVKVTVDLDEGPTVSRDEVINAFMEEIYDFPIEATDGIHDPSVYRVMNVERA